MRPARVLPIALAAVLALAPATGRAADALAQPVDSSTWVDHDGRPVAQPKLHETNLVGHQFREAILEPWSHAFDVPDKILWLLGPLGASRKHPAINVNRYDEVPNSEWFTNRNHVRSVPPDEIRLGPKGDLVPKPPFTVSKPKTEGATPGFQVKDADGKKWLFKGDPVGFPQLASGADAISLRLTWAAGYNLPHNVPVRVRREDLKIDKDLEEGKEGKPFHDVDLDQLLTRGHRYEDGSSSMYASLFLEGAPVGPINARERRPDDPNDLYNHRNRREWRGLYVVMSWLNSWDTKDHQYLDMFLAPEKGQPGHVKHHVLDVGASLGAEAEGAKEPQRGYEYTLDWAWMARRLFSLGFAVEPWRRAHQETGIPSVGNFAYDVYDPDKFRSLQPQAAFRERTKADGYWGAKLVCSFSDAQIRAAVAAAHYDDPRATEYITKALIERRDRVGRYWFGEVTPVDFFSVADGELRFHDLAVDRGLAAERHYRVEVRPDRGARRTLDLDRTRLALSSLDPSWKSVRLEFRAGSSDARPTRVDLVHRGESWDIALVRHAE